MLIEEGEGSSAKRYTQRRFSDQTEVDYWESVYDRQDFLGSCYKQRMNQALSWLDGVNLPKDAMILDAGCGAGVVAGEVARRGHLVFGMDFSRDMVDRANTLCNTRAGLNVQLLQGDIQRLPFKDSSFDSIVCLGVITYLRSEENAVREFSRVLKPQGILILSILNKAHLLHYVDLPNRAKPLIRKVLNTWSNKELTEADDVVRRYFIPKLKNALERQGFVVLEFKTVPLRLVTLFGHELPPKGLNIKVTMFMERFSRIPLVGSLGGMCIFYARKELLCNAKLT